MIDIFENYMKQSLYKLTKREVLLCNMVRRRIDEINAFHLRHRETTEFKPIDLALEIHGALYAYGIPQYAKIFDLYCQRIFAQQAKSGIDIFTWQKSINEYLSMRHGIVVQLRTINKDDARVLFKDNVDASIAEVKKQIAIAKENGDTSAVVTNSKKLAGLTGVFQDTNHMVKVVSFPKYNIGFIYILSTKAKVKEYTDNVASLGEGVVFGDSAQEQFVVDYGIKVVGINAKLQKYDIRLVEDDNHPLNIIQAYGRDAGRAAFQAVMYGTDTYRIGAKKKTVETSEVESNSVDETKLEVQEESIDA